LISIKFLGFYLGLRRKKPAIRPIATDAIAAPANIVVVSIALDAFERGYAVETEAVVVGTKLEDELLDVTGGLLLALGWLIVL